MKRIKAACITQTLCFSSHDGERTEYAKKAIVQECEKCKAQLEKSGTKYRIISEKTNEDGYENFGWELEGTESGAGKLVSDTIEMKFKRDRKIRNKAELTRLQRNFDACVSEILSLEAGKYVKVSIVAHTVGIIGTAFMAGSVFVVTAGMIVPCILLAISAFIGWILPYFPFLSVEKKKLQS